MKPSNNKNSALKTHLRWHEGKRQILTADWCIERSQKIIRSLARSVWLNLSRCWIKLKEILLHVFPNFQYGSHIPTSVTVVRSAKDCHHILFLTPIITLHDKLVGSWDESEPIGMVELGCYVLSKSITSSAWRYSPPTSIVWIRPQQITHWPFMWNLHRPTT